MKTLATFLIFISLLMSCNKEKGDESTGGPIPTNNQFDVCFVNDEGTWLIDRLPVELPKGELGCRLSPSRYSLRRWNNNIEIVMPDDYPIEANMNVMVYPGSGFLRFQCGIAPVPGQSVWEIDHVFKLVFSCPELFGDEREHTFIVIKKGSTIGYQNYAERIYFDGKLIASNVEGDSDQHVPIVVTVPTK